MNMMKGLTMRQRHGHLAYAITSGLDCTDIVSFSRTKLQADLFKGMVFSTDFSETMEISLCMKLLS